jgi:16S rRNA (adenine(1408)-N(1))-methyltransferase
VDLGTGDGRAVVARARREPGALVIGMDASAAGMAEESRRAARPQKRGGLPNALFVVAVAECPPVELQGIADDLTILFPWSSLLRGVLALDGAAADGIAGLVRDGGRVDALVSITERDGLGLAPLRAEDGPRIAGRWASHGLTLVAFEPATAEEIAATGSTWARRLGAAESGGPLGTRGRRRAERPVWHLALRRGCDLTHER